LIAEEIDVDMDCGGFTLFIEGDDITQSLLADFKSSRFQ